MKKIIFLLCLTVAFVSAANARQSPAEDSTLQQYVGKYKFPDGSVIADVTVSLNDGILSMASSAGVSPLEKQGEDKFSIPNFQGTAKFNRDSNKKVIGVSIDARGFQLEGTKAEGTASINLENKFAVNASVAILQVR